MHAILTVLISYLLYKSNTILHFFNEYLESVQIISDTEVISKVFHILIFAFPFLVIVFSIIILWILVKKEKPITFYIVIIFSMIYSIFIYNYSYNTVLKMQTMLVEIQLARFIRDLLLINVLIQVGMLIISFIRATGFDIKKFDFVKDLQELKIDIKDNEEFEIDVNLNTNKVKRRFKQKIRHLKYLYVENKFWIHMLTSLFIGLICFLMYINLTIYNKTYKENEAFLTEKFMMSAEKSYITNLDYRGKKVTDNTFVIIDLKIKSNSSIERVLDTVNFDLFIKDQKFKHTSTYKDKFIDLGKTYENDPLKNTFENYLLVFEIPSSLKEEKMTLGYMNEIKNFGSNLLPKYIKISLNPETFNKDENKTYTVGEPIDFNESILKTGKLLIKEIDIAPIFIRNYTFCVTKKECYNSKEYIKPSVMNTYDKTLLKITGVLEDTNSSIGSDVYNLINLFGKITYEINGEKKIQKVQWKQVIPQHKLNNTYYIEVLKEIEKAEKITLLFELRDQKYEYILK